MTPTPTAAKVLPVVFVIDDDASVRAALSSLIRSVGLRVEVFASASEFLAAKRTDGPSCLILDVRLPGMSGLNFQAELAKANSVIPIIFITGHFARLREPNFLRLEGTASPLVRFRLAGRASAPSPDTPRRLVPLEPRRNYTGALRFRASPPRSQGRAGEGSSGSPQPPPNCPRLCGGGDTPG